jgi:membrane protein insertase Oxa1/YidC/SpoIIIJ
MVVWAFIVFVVGIVVFLFYILDVFASFAPWLWSIILFVIAIGMLNRIWTKEKLGEKEKLAQRVIELEEELQHLQPGKKTDTSEAP